MAAIREVVAGLVEAWDAGDGRAWATSFAEDADFTAWFGLELSGREPIAQGHDFIFHDFYAGTALRLEVRKIRFLGANVAVVHMAGSVTDAGEPAPDEPSMVPLAVMERRDGGWTIVAFQNTPFVVEQFREHGDLRDFKAATFGPPTE